MATPWQISVDTGGTFTDCYGIPPGSTDHEAQLVKVLSSGRLRISVQEAIDDRTFRLAIPHGWQTPEGFFVGFDAEIAGKRNPVMAWENATKILHLRDPSALGEVIELHASEEAPVVGARLLTGTGLAEAFPPLTFRLGTTRGTNALLERKGAPTALFITRGFGDLLTIRDQRRPDLFALAHHQPPPLFERVIEIDERLDAEGNLLTPLATTFEDAARRALADGISVAAVALMHSYRNPAHEEELRARLLALGFDHVSLSAELAPLIKILPRAETAVVDATLTPVMQQFTQKIRSALGETRPLLIMTSAGGLEPAQTFRPKDSLLSGPAGGVVGAAAAARELGFDRILTFDMGGTSTDVARVDGDFHYRFEQKVGDARLLAPALSIETVASGGGSLCQWTEAGLRVGPESAGSDPGPACYGRGGPLTMTDVNLLLGRIDPDNFGIPIGAENLDAARRALTDLAAQVPGTSESALLEGVLAISTEQMADAIRTISIREGADPADYALVAFGGAGPLHACDIAEKLGIRSVIVPREAGLLSAYGIHHAVVERFAERQVLAPLHAIENTLEETLNALACEARDQLRQDLSDHAKIIIRRRLAEVRLMGQDATMTVEIESPSDIGARFRRQYAEVFGYPPDPAKALEIVTLRVIASTENPATTRPNPVKSATQPCWIGDPNAFFVNRDALTPGTEISGPRVIQDPFSTLFLKVGWTATVSENHALIVTPQVTAETPAAKPTDSAIERELFRHRFENLVDEMGAMLQRSAISTNVKERADYSCALLNAAGELVVNAPHIPVHLGALGLCVREVARAIPMRPGDTIITNHPGYGGSHLPDVTLITPIFATDSGDVIGYVANRAHHAEIGGIAPGSMPPHARSLAEEGVVIPPCYLVEGGRSRFDQIERQLTTDAPYPTRHLADNLADLHAQLAANRRGADLLSRLVETHGAGCVTDHLQALARQARESLRDHLNVSGFTEGSATESLDDGTEIHCRISRREGHADGGLVIDFTGSTDRHPGNLNATPAIIRSAVLYVMRLWSQSPMPLNEGLLRDVEIVLPTCFLNPRFPDDPRQCPAVVGGNVETSQRVVDTLIRILGFQAGSQGTMNNLIFGNDHFGYYETIGGGSGAGPTYDGASGLHTHMTNTAITDPEILERRYPVRLRQFSLRPDSGGAGFHRGGDGLIREIQFLAPLQVSLLTQHRVEAPFGLNGGSEGRHGRQTLRRATETIELDGIAAIAAEPGDILRLETPGGGGYGVPR